MESCEMYSSQDDVHKPRDHHPSIWGDFFLTHTSCTPEEYGSMKERAETLREEVRKIISSASDPLKMLQLVDAVQRLGLDYHYETEIDKLLHYCIDDTLFADDDLQTVALQFYLLRKHGYNVSPNVFLKFKDGNGNFTSTETRSLLSLYNAAHLRTHGEELLDEAIAFTTNHFKSIVQDLEPHLAKEVLLTLEAPLFRRVRRHEIINYIPIYENEPTRNDSILQLAKLEFNLSQVLYCEELKTITLWWKELELQSKLRFARDRAVEMHFWMSGMLFEPHYSYARIMLTKMVTFFSIIDDINDNYSTSEESNEFTRAMERWDEKAADLLPEYLKFFYLKVLNTVKATEDDLALDKNNHIIYLRKVMADAAKAYNDEGKWRDDAYVPATVEEHLQMSVQTSVCMHICCLAFIGMGKIATNETIEWAFSMPDVVRALCIIGRVSNDIMSHEREQESEHVVSTVETCMKEHGVGMEEACEKLRVLIEGAWKDISEGCLRPTAQPMPLMETVIDLARTMDMMYKHCDAYTLSYTIEDKIRLLYIKPIPV